jgi:hypothetical protein
MVPIDQVGMKINQVYGFNMIYLYILLINYQLPMDLNQVQLAFGWTNGYQWLPMATNLNFQ